MMALVPVGTKVNFGPQPAPNLDSGDKVKFGKDVNGKVNIKKVNAIKQKAQQYGAK